MNRLAIDTSNEVLAVAVEKEGTVVVEKMTNVKGGQTPRLMPAIVDAMELAELEPDQLDEIIVGRGPGSYTGIRVGVTTAKTMAWGLGIPIIPVSSLGALAYNARLYNGYVMPFFNARRQAMFTSLYKFSEGKFSVVIEETYVPFSKWKETLEQFSNEKIVCISPHLDVFQEQLETELEGRVFLPPKEAHLLRPSNLLAYRAEVEAKDVHLVKPHYLRITEAEANLIKRQKSE
ncbi:MAG TPA: tRNA (adenosine(37)-N6)-threonylcarbamoyltransferase complex dimerization subunit type 1 TsaB [Pseudogracilibacillus sp.]|nr:tRNA (adenosine(37)-N6)-threonylcarbamoyltransferase complex dimerization subunit type 1 TsaB [Pseudogracilibacillus sp.]